MNSGSTDRRLLAFGLHENPFCTRVHFSASIAVGTAIARRLQCRLPCDPCCGFRDASAGDKRPWAYSTNLMFPMQRTKLGGWMKRLAWILAFPLLIPFAGRAQSAPTHTMGNDEPREERLFLPRDMFWGWAQFDLAPPHNEIDPNLCAGNAGQYGGVNAPCSLFARYMLSGMLEVRPFGRGQLRRFMVFGAPAFLFGKTIPKTLYTWSPDAIGIEHSWGVGIFIAKGLSFARPSISCSTGWARATPTWARPTWATTGPGDDTLRWACASLLGRDGGDGCHTLQ